MVDGDGLLKESCYNMGNIVAILVNIELMMVSPVAGMALISTAVSCKQKLQPFPRWV